MATFWEPPVLLSCWVVPGTYLFRLIFCTLLVHQFTNSHHSESFTSHCHVHSLPGWHVFMSSSLVRAAALVNSSVKSEEMNETYSGPFNCVSCIPWPMNLWTMNFHPAPSRYFQHVFPSLTPPGCSGASAHCCAEGRWKVKCSLKGV